MIAGPAPIGAVSSLPNMASFTVNEGAEFADVTSFEDGNTVELKGYKTMAGTLEGHFDDDEDRLYIAADLDTPVYLYFYPTKLNMQRYWYGLAWIDVSTSVSNKDAVKISANWKAAGTWYRKTRGA